MGRRLVSLFRERLGAMSCLLASNARHVDNRFAFTQRLTTVQVDTGSRWPAIQSSARLKLYFQMKPRDILDKILIAIAESDREAWDALFDVTCAIEDSEMKADVLNNLLVMPGHELHQQVAMEIQGLKSPSSVPYIRSVLANGFDYLAYTCSEDGTIAKWFSHALAEIGTPVQAALTAVRP